MTTTTATECRECGATDSALFGYNPRRCKACVNAAAREYRRTGKGAELQRQHRERNPELHRVYAFRQQLKSMGLTPADYDALLESQGGACAICRRTDPGGKGRWHIDHDHDCCPGKKSCGECVRGLLCFRCNAGLGQLNDDRSRLLAAVEYLDRHKRGDRK